MRAISAFVSSRGGSQQIWTVAAEGGEARQLTTLPADVDNLRWSPTGEHLAFTAEVYPDADMAQTAQRDKAKAAIWRNGLLVLPSGQRSVRFRPPLNLSAAEADAGLDIVRRSLEQL